MFPTDLPIMRYPDLSGAPLNNGYIYIGEVNKNPETNPITVYWDYAGTQPATQPIRTTNGYSIRSGIIAPIFVDRDFSITIRDSLGRLVYTALKASEAGSFAAGLLSQNGASLIVWTQYLADSVATTIDKKLKESVSIFDFMTEVQRNDVQGGVGSIDVSAAVQKAWDKCYGTGDVVRQLRGFGKVRITQKISIRSGFSGEGPFDSGGGMTFLWHGSGATIFENTAYDGGWEFENLRVDMRNVTSDTLAFHFKRGLTSSKWKNVRFFGWDDGNGFFAKTFKNHDGIKIDGDNGSGGKADISLNTFERVYFGSALRRGFETTDPFAGAAGGESSFIDCFGLCKEWVFRTTGRANTWIGGDFAARSTFSVWKFTGQYASGTTIEGCSAECETAGDTAIICDADTSPAGSMGAIIGGKVYTGGWYSDLGLGTRLQRWFRTGDEDGIASVDCRGAFLRGINALTTDFTRMGGVIGQGGKFMWLRGSSDAVCGSIALGNSSGAAADPGGTSGVSAIIQAASTSNFRVIKTSAGTDMTEVWRINNDRWCSNTGAAPAAMLDLVDPLAGDAGIISQIGGSSTPSIKLYAVTGGGAPAYNAADTGMKIVRNVGTGRSINAAGTLNASGADYAEYERKRDDCGAIVKGQIVGFDAGGLLTDKWSLLFRPGIKSTNPCVVGGDIWGAEDVIGKEPVKPVRREAVTRQVEIQHGESDKDFNKRTAEWRRARDAAKSKGLSAKHRPAKPKRIEPQYEIVIVEPEEAEDEFAARMQAWKAEDAAWRNRLEVERAKVDRIAYAGKVPCNVIGAQPGDYIIAQEGSRDSIIGAPVKNPTFEQYRYAVGRVNRILPDGRAEVAVIIH